VLTPMFRWPGTRSVDVGWNAEFCLYLYYLDKTFVCDHITIYISTCMLYIHCQARGVLLVAYITEGKYMCQCVNVFHVLLPRYAECCCLLLYYLEQSLRLVFATVNNCQDRVVTAEVRFPAFW